MDNIIVMVMEPEGVWEEKVIPNTLEALQELVGGYIEAIRIHNELIVIVDEEGKLKNKQTNMYLPGDRLVGTVVVVGENGEEFADCPEGFRKCMKGKACGLLGWLRKPC